MLNFLNIWPETSAFLTVSMEMTSVALTVHSKCEKQFFERSFLIVYNDHTKSQERKKETGWKKETVLTARSATVSLTDQNSNCTLTTFTKIPWEFLDGACLWLWIMNGVSHELQSLFVVLGWIFFFIKGLLNSEKVAKEQKEKKRACAKSGKMCLWPGFTGHFCHWYFPHEN